MATKKSRKRKVVKLKCTTADTWRQDFDEGFIIVANPDGSRPDDGEPNHLRNALCRVCLAIMRSYQQPKKEKL